MSDVMMRENLRCSDEANMVETRVQFKRKLKSLIAIASETNGESESKESLGKTDFSSRKAVPEMTVLKDGGDVGSGQQVERESNSTVKFSQEKIRNLMQAFTNTQVAHEIAINPDYRLQPIPKSGTSLNQKRFHDVFWELFEEEVKMGTDLKQTVGIIGELKQEILSLMMPQNCELHEHVDRMMDTGFVREKVASKEFDYKFYADYILSVLKKICCPSRDTEIVEIGLLKSPASIYKRIFSLIESMKLDMENFFITLSRPYIIKCAIEKERRKLADYLELEYRIHEDGLSATRAWLLRHRTDGRDTGVTIAKAYGDMLRTNVNRDWPETISRDIPKLIKFQERLKKITIIGGVVLEVSKAAQKLFKKPPPGLRGVFSRYMKVIVDKADVSSREGLQACLEKVAREAVEVAALVISKCMKRTITAREKCLIYEAVMKLLKPENYFRALLTQRAIDYAEELIVSGNEYHVPLPPSLMVVMNEVALLMLDFLRVVYHNQSCFDDLYRDIVEDKAPSPVFPSQNNGNWDITVLWTLRNLREEALMGPSRSVELEAGSDRLQRNFEKERLFLQEAFKNSFLVDASRKKSKSEITPLEETGIFDAQLEPCHPGPWAEETLKLDNATSDSCLDERLRRQVRFEEAEKTENDNVLEKFSKYFQTTCCHVISQDSV